MEIVVEYFNEKSGCEYKSEKDSWKAILRNAIK